MSIRGLPELQREIERKQKEEQVLKDLLTGFLALLLLISCFHFFI